MAAATTIIAAGTQLAGAGASFAQAAKQNRLRREAENAAKKYMEDARNAYKTNFAEAVQVPMEGYEMAADLNRQAASQALDAMRESGQRAVIGGVAGLQRQAQAGSEELRLNLQQDLEERNRLIIGEEANIRDRIAGLDLNMATGAQQAAADAQTMRAQSIQSGISSLAGAGNTLFESSKLYKDEDESGKKGVGMFGKKTVGGKNKVDNPAAGVVGKPRFSTLPTRF